MNVSLNQQATTVRGRSPAPLYVDHALRQEDASATDADTPEETSLWAHGTQRTVHGAVPLALHGRYLSRWAGARRCFLALGR